MYENKPAKQVSLAYKLVIVNGLDSLLVNFHGLFRS